MSTPSKECIKEIRNDLKIFRSREKDSPSIWCVQDEERVNLLHALFMGPEESRYEKGFFYFTLHMPDDYHQSPPTVQLLTTGGDTVFVFNILSPFISFRWCFCAFFFPFSF